MQSSDICVLTYITVKSSELVFIKKKKSSELVYLLAGLSSFVAVVLFHP